MADASLSVVAVNHGVRTWFGRDPSGEALRSLFPEDQHAALTELIHQAPLGGPARMVQLRVHAAAGVRTVRLRLTKGEALGQVYYTVCLGDSAPSLAKYRKESKERSPP